MHEEHDKPRALFLLRDGICRSDLEVCSGAFPSLLEGEPCPFADGGRIPLPHTLDEAKARSIPDLGRNDDLIPPCAFEQLGSLAELQENIECLYPEELWDLRVFKCRQMFLLVIPGLRDDRANDIEEGD